jgi:2'-5' RNA ligase
MSFLGLRVPHETARLLGGLEVPGKREAVSSFHVTMFFFGDNLDIDRLVEIVRVTFGVVAGTKPFTARTSQLTSFPAPEDAPTPIICRVESDALHDLRDRVKEAYDAAGIEYSNKHPEYKPHVTLAYADGGGVEEKRIPTVEWGAHELVLWGGDSGDDTLIVTFPFALGDLDTLASKVARRYRERP